MRPRLTWKLRTRRLELGGRTLIMGVLNVTPDSFSDGGKHLLVSAAVEHAVRMLEEGADMIDIGGESTRPGAATGDEGVVPAEEEMRRVLPVIGGIRRARPEAILSVDTHKAEVARHAVTAGAEIVNDVSAMTWDEQMAETVADLGSGVVLMHTRGRPHEWRTLPAIEDVVGLVERELGEAAERALAAGIERGRIVLDAGFGFGKRYEENYSLLARLGELARLGYPLLAGVSRKSFVGRAMGNDAPAAERLTGTLAANTMAILQGAHILRVHDVRPAREAANLVDAVIAEEKRETTETERHRG